MGLQGLSSLSSSEPPAIATQCRLTDSLARIKPEPYDRSVVVALLLPAGLGGEGEGDLGAVGLAEDGLGLVGPGHAVLVLGQGDADLPKSRYN